MHPIKFIFLVFTLAASAPLCAKANPLQDQQPHFCRYKLELQGYTPQTFTATGNSKAAAVAKNALACKRWAFRHAMISRNNPNSTEAMNIAQQVCIEANLSMNQECQVLRSI